MGDQVIQEIVDYSEQIQAIVLETQRINERLEYLICILLVVVIYGVCRIVYRALNIIY